MTPPAHAPREGLLILVAAAGVVAGCTSSHTNQAPPSDEGPGPAAPDLRATEPDAGAGFSLPDHGPIDPGLYCAHGGRITATGLPPDLPFGEWTREQAAVACEWARTVLTPIEECEVNGRLTPVNGPSCEDFLLGKTCDLPTCSWEACTFEGGKCRPDIPLMRELCGVYLVGGC